MQEDILCKDPLRNVSDWGQVNTKPDDSGNYLILKISLLHQWQYLYSIYIMFVHIFYCCNLHMKYCQHNKMMFSFWLHLNLDTSPMTARHSCNMFFGYHILFIEMRKCSNRPDTYKSLWHNFILIDCYRVVVWYQKAGNRNSYANTTNMISQKYT